LCGDKLGELAVCDQVVGLGVTKLGVDKLCVSELCVRKERRE
jgi:hypothetical protein